MSNYNANSSRSFFFLIPKRCKSACPRSLSPSTKRPNNNNNGPLSAFCKVAPSETEEKGKERKNDCFDE
jgi:hypothetical protein